MVPANQRYITSDACAIVKIILLSENARISWVNDVGCGECERVCPMDLPLMLINQKMIDIVKDIYDYESGKNPEQAPLLSQFKMEDDESFIK